MLQESDRERERIAAARTEQKGRMAAAGRTERTDEERQALRPEVWVAQSPMLIHKRAGGCICPSRSGSRSRARLKIAARPSPT